MQINLIFTTTVLHLASFWNVTEPHSASLSKRLSDFQKGFEILCPWIRGQLKNPGVCALGFSFAPCKGKILLFESGRNPGFHWKRPGVQRVSENWTFRFTVLCFVVTLSLSSTSETKWYLLRFRPPYRWSWNLPAGRKGNGQYYIVSKLKCTIKSSLHHRWN